MICLACGWKEDNTVPFMDMCPHRYRIPHDEGHKRAVVAALLALGWDAETPPTDEMHRKAIAAARATRP